MQVAFTPQTPAEARLIACFFQDYAEMLEQQVAQLPLPTLTPPADVALPVEAKKSRTRRTSAPSAEPAPSSSPETVTPAEPETPPVSSGSDEGNEAVQAVTEPAASSEVQAGATEEKPASPDASPVPALDDLRKLFGELSQAGKRTGAIAIVKSYKSADGKACMGLAEIPEANRAEVFEKLKAL